MNRSSSLLFYKLVSAAILAGVIASFTGLARVYRTPDASTTTGLATVSTTLSAHPNTTTS